MSYCPFYYIRVLLFFHNRIKNLNCLTDCLSRTINAKLPTVHTEDDSLQQRPLFVCVVVIITGTALSGPVDHIFCFFGRFVVFLRKTG